MLFITEALSYTGYRIHEGSKFCWKCFGKNAYAIDFVEKEDEAEYSVTVVYDLETKEVYSLELSYYVPDERSQTWMWIDKNYRERYEKERLENYISDDTDEYRLPKKELLRAIADILPQENRVNYYAKLSKPDLKKLTSATLKKELTSTEWLHSYFNKLLK